MSSTSVHLCPLCDKPFTLESSFNRHVTYCRRTQNRTRNRQRSCKTCHYAKAKCSFQHPCMRCSSRGLDCVYDRPLPTEISTSTAGSVSLSSNDGALLPFGDFDLREVSSLSDLFGADHQSLHGWFDNSSLTAEFPGSVNDEPVFASINPRPSPWKVTSSKDDTNKVIALRDPELFLSRLRTPEPLSQQSRRLVMDALCAIPEQMLRRATFPPFIHPHWHTESLPESLAVCTKIAQMFITRTAETSPFIWRTILSESRRTIAALPKLSKQNLLAATQAGMVYLIMRVVDGTSTSPSASVDKAWNQEMALCQTLLCDRFLEICDGKFCEDESPNPSLTWEDWIFAESRRRTSCVWFLITRTLVVNTKEGCPTNEQPWMLPLPGSKLQWEARTRESWLEEMSVGCSAITNFGELMESKRRCDERVHAQRLDSWNARTDNLGTLLNVAVAVV